MSQTADLNRAAVEELRRRWETALEDFPQARAQAVEAMGQAAQRALEARIGEVDLQEDAKGTVRAWQELRLGSGGGYAALSPIRANPSHPGQKPKSWNGKAVTVRQITKWLERRHRIRQADTTKAYAWSRSRRARSTGARRVAGRGFYAWVQQKAWELARDAAEETLRCVTGEGEG